MPLIEIDDQNVPLVVDLDEAEKEQWRKEFGDIRKKEQLPPSEYIDKAVERLGGHETLRQKTGQTTELILEIRETAWQIYIQHEQMVCGQAMQMLFRTNPHGLSSKPWLPARVSQHCRDAKDRNLSTVWPVSFVLVKT